MPRLAGHRVDGGEVRRDVGVGVEGVDHVVELSGCRGPIRIGILGYGNLGRGIELAVAANDDMELVGVFTRRGTPGMRGAAAAPSISSPWVGMRRVNTVTPRSLAASMSP